MHGSTGGSWRRSVLWQPIHGGPRKTEGLEPGFAYGSPPRQLPTQPRPPEGWRPAKPLGPLEREALSQAMDWLQTYIVSYSGDDLEHGFCDDTVAFAQFCVERDRETGGRDTPPSDEELREAKELDQVTLGYIECLLTKYRVFDVAR